MRSRATSGAGATAAAGDGKEPLALSSAGAGAAGEAGRHPHSSGGARSAQDDSSRRIVPGALASEGAGSRGWDEAAVMLDMSPPETPAAASQAAAPGSAVGESAQ